MYFLTFGKVEAVSRSLRYLLIGLVTIMALLNSLPVHAQEGGKLVALYFETSTTEKTSDPCYPNYRWDRNDLNAGAGHNPFNSVRFIYLCGRYEPLSSTYLPAITELHISKHGSRPSAANRCPAGWTGVASANEGTLDMNFTNGGDYLYLCFKTGGAGVPLIDIDITPGGVCRNGYRRINTNLNEGNVSAITFTFLCYADLSSIGIINNCGGENEQVCGEYSTYPACDRGLRAEGNICVNDGRHSTAAINFRNSWLHWAMMQQTNVINYDRQFGRFSMVGAHNAYNNIVDGYALTNQDISITAALTMGIRLIDLDVYAFETVAFTNDRALLCHGICSPGDRQVVPAIKEIKQWMLSDYGQNQTIVILLEDYMDDAGHLIELALQEHLNVPGVGIYGKFDILANDNKLPSRKQMLEAGKRVLVLTQNQNFGEVGVRKTAENPNVDISYASTRGGVPVNNFVGSPTCSNTGGDLQTPKFHEGTVYQVTEVNGDRLPEGAVAITPSSMRRLTECAVDFINMDGVAPSPTDNRLHASIWSWTVDDWGNFGAATVMNNLSGRWQSRDPSEQHTYACYQPEIQHTGVTTTSGPFEGGWNACKSEFGESASFFVPRNGWENKQLHDNHPGAGDIWINWSKLNPEAIWTSSNQFEMTLSGPESVVESDIRRRYNFTYKAPRAGMNLSVIADCGPYGIFEERYGVYIADPNAETGSGYIRCSFPAGGNEFSPLTLNYVSAILRADVAGYALEVGEEVHMTIENHSPEFDDVVLSKDVIIEGEKLSVRVRAYDLGEDEIRHVVDWGDGGYIDYISTIGVQDHSYIYQDDPPGSDNKYLLNFRVSDEWATASEIRELTVQNAPPDIDEMSLMIAGGPPVGNGAKIPMGAVIRFDGSFSDPGTLDTHTMTLDWGDGSPVDTTPNPTHTYESVGVYAVTWTITDDDGGVVSESLNISTFDDLIFCSSMGESLPCD